MSKTSSSCGPGGCASGMDMRCSGFLSAYRRWHWEDSFLPVQMTARWLEPPKTAISLRYLAGLTHDEAAQAMGCSKAVMAVTLHRATAALRRAMQAGTAEGGAA